MRVIMLAGLTALATTLPAQAALQAHYQRQIELGEIIASVQDAFMVEGQLVESIVMQREDFYLVGGGPCQMEVAIVDIPPKPDEEPMPGPRRFAVETGPLVCN